MSNTEEKETIAPEDMIAVIAAKETVPLFAKQKILVRDSNPIELMKNIQALVQQGCTLEEDTYPSVRNVMMEVKFIKQCDVNKLSEDMIVSRPGVQASPIEHSEYKHSVEFVKELPWETFKNLLKAVGIGGKDRSKMLNQYLKYFSE